MTALEMQHEVAAVTEADKAYFQQRAEAEIELAQAAEHEEGSARTTCWPAIISTWSITSSETMKADRDVRPKLSR